MVRVYYFLCIDSLHRKKVRVYHFLRIDLRLLGVISSYTDIEFAFIIS